MSTSASISFNLLLPRRERRRRSCGCGGGGGGIRTSEAPPAFRVKAAAVREEGVVIVGAGIGGLSTAASLNRLGVRSLVLEQGESLRTGGTSLTLFKNGWRVLDAIGVADELRNQFLQLQGLAIKSDDGRELRSFSFKEEAPGQEVRAVERECFLEALANELPDGAIRFSSRLKDVRRDEEGKFLLDLADGSQLLAKFLVGADGVNSPVAKWMGFSEPNYVGHCAFRGLAVYPDGQPFHNTINYIYGRGIRVGCVPVSTTKVYWFVVFNSKAPGPKIVDPSELKKEARELARNCPSNILHVIETTPDSNIIKSPLVDRWLWPFLSPPASSGGVVVIGDAWHPMTPNLGQGACCALEDSVVLAKKLAGVVHSSEQGHIAQTLKTFSDDRWKRVFPMTVRANLVGSLLQLDNPLFCAFRDGIVFPKLASLNPILEHTNFECELPEEISTN